MNITDIDDKIIARSLESGRTTKDIALEYEKEFFNDLRKLNVIEPNIKIRVTDHLPTIIKFITQIVEKGMAYVAEDGSVYFNVEKYPHYGKLQNLKVENRNNIDLEKKEKTLKVNEADFALWKAKKHLNEPAWKSPWGEGRPGWHIECSALASEIFGEKIDFHAGGVDLRFPHHENEDAQSCVFHDTNQWVNYWLHVGQLSLKGDVSKMSKSLKNTISVDEMLQKYSPDDFRMGCLMSHYRDSMEYSDEMMEMASNTLKKFKAFASDCLAYVSGTKPVVDIDCEVIKQNLVHANKEIKSALSDDFNTSYAISVLLDQISSISRCINNKTSESAPKSSAFDTVAAAYNFVTATFDMFGIELGKTNQISIEKDEIDFANMVTSIIDSRFQLRQKAIKEKNSSLFQACDEIRNCFLRSGIDIKDHGKGSTWEYIGKYIKTN